VLATVLREGATNVLRHSKADRCVIALRRVDDAVVLEIVNDAREGNRVGGEGDGGKGLQNMEHRVTALGGRMAYFTEDGDFVLRVAVPVTAGAC
jgi:signal transduction histidine kinase